MAKITNVTFLQFGVNANTASDVCAFGTPATGSPVYTGNIATLQANAAWLTGWAAETIASNRPFLEDMNAFCIVVAYMLAYIKQEGICEWDSGTTYYTNSIVQSGGILYQSLVDSNLDNAVGSNANWRQYTAPAPYIKASETQASGTSGQTALTTGSWITVILNTKDNDSASIATLSSNQISLPSGTYEIFAMVPCYDTGASETRLYNVTAATTLIIGSSVTATRDPGVIALCQDSVIQGQFVLANTSSIAIQVQVGIPSAYGGIGQPSSFGTEVYTVVTINKVA